MQLQFTNTFADFLDGVKAIRQPYGPTERRRNWEPLIAIIGGFVSAFVLLVIAAIVTPRDAAGEAEQTFFMRFATSFVIWLILQGFVWGLLTMANHPDFRPAMRMYLLILLVFSAGTTALSIALTPPELPAPAPKAEEESKPLIGFLPLIVNMAGIAGGFYFLTRSIHRRTWDASTLLHLPQTITFLEDEFLTDCGVVQSRYQWSAFVVFRETKTQFILQPTRMSFIMIPKRVCRDEKELETVRQWLERKVMNPQPQHTGFAVVPMANAAPPPLPPR